MDSKSVVASGRRFEPYWRRFLLCSRLITLLVSQMSNRWDVRPALDQIGGIPYHPALAGVKIIESDGIL